MPVSPQDFELYSRMTGAPMPTDAMSRMQMAPDVYNFTKNHDPSAYKEKTNKEDKIYIENSPNPSINDQVVENSSIEKINIKSLLIKMIETNDAENAKKTIEDIFILIQDSPGTSEVNLHVTSKDKIVKILLPKKVDINKILTERLIEVVGENNVSTIR